MLLPMKRFLVTLLTFCALLAARAQGPDDLYLQIYRQIEQADTYASLGQKDAAAALYQEALGSLQKFKTVNPKWNENIVAFRVQDTQDKLAALANRPAKATAEKPAPEGPVDWAKQAQFLSENVRRLEAEKAELAAKLKEALSVQPASVDPGELRKAQEEAGRLQKENDLLKVSLEQARAKVAGPGKEGSRKTDADVEKARNEAREKYKKEIASLEDRLAAANSQIDDLRKEMAARSKGGEKELERELEATRAKLRVFEAKAVPYTAEELAFIKKGEMAPAAPAPAVVPAAAPATAPGVASAPAEKPVAKSVKHVSHELPPGSGPIMAEAARAMKAGQFEEAKVKLLQILAMDTSNLATLENLTTCDINLTNLVEAEQYITRALAVDPGDGPLLSLVGTLRYKQGRLDEALTYLSRAVEIDPKDSEAQNILGVTLMEKGQPKAAETAFRKALQSRPDYGWAHFNLALVYANSKPPFMHLARFHYQKSVMYGHAADAELEKLIGH
jgi:tetratricopeptide (TPR) repeat protein